MRYHIVPVTPLVQNCSVVWCTETGVGAVIDPGGDAARIMAAAGEVGVTVTHVLLTHGHIDHVGAAGAVSAATGAEIWGPERGDRFLMELLPQQAELFGLELAVPFAPHRWLSAGDSVRFGSVELAVLHCPGHTPGHVAYHCAAAATVFTGDVLFRGSIGRTDLPGGDHAALLNSIRRQLWPLGDDTVFVPGHGPAGRLGEERRANPFLG